MKVLVHTANLGNVDTPAPPVDQVTDADVTFKVFTDVDFPPRPKAMTRRLQSKIPKMFGWDLLPGYDVYLWHDASLQVHQPDTVAWFLEQLGDDDDIVVFKHPWRNSAADEAEFICTKMMAGSHYIKSRYEGEDLAGQMAEIRKADWYDDKQFYAGGAFCYRPGGDVREALERWWVYTSRFHCIDQLAFAFTLHQYDLDIKVLDEDIYHASHLLWRGHNR